MYYVEKIQEIVSEIILLNINPSSVYHLLAKIIFIFNKSLKYSCRRLELELASAFNYFHSLHVIQDIYQRNKLFDEDFRSKTYIDIYMFTMTL